MAFEIEPDNEIEPEIIQEPSINNNDDDNDMWTEEYEEEEREVTDR
jgi:hypothetical protein